MNILSLDQSITSTGYWINTKNHGGTIITKPYKEDSNTNRIIFIRDRIRDMIEANNIDTIIMEDYSYGARNTRFTFTAGELGFAIKEISYDRKLNLIVIPPTLLKKFVCGKGNAKKQNMLLACYKRFNREFYDDNICDAFCLLTLYNAYNKWKSKELTEFADYEIECFKALDKLIEGEKDGK